MVYRNNTGRMGFWLHQCVLRNTLAVSKTMVSNSRDDPVCNTKWKMGGDRFWKGWHKWLTPGIELQISCIQPTLRIWSDVKTHPRPRHELVWILSWVLVGMKRNEGTDKGKRCGEGPVRHSGVLNQHALRCKVDSAEVLLRHASRIQMNLGRQPIQ